jgi:hypothetical protein
VKEMYEQAVQESAGTKTSSQQRAAEVRSDKARSIKERFEKGEPLLSDSEETEQKCKGEDMSVFEAGTLHPTFPAYYQPVFYFYFALGIFCISMFS